MKWKVGIIFIPRTSEHLSLLCPERNILGLSVVHNSHLPVVINIFNTVRNIPQGIFDTNSCQPFRVNNGIFTFTFSPPVVDSPPGHINQTRLHLFDSDLSNSRIEELRYQILNTRPTVSDVARSNSSKCVPRSRKRQRGDIISSIHLYGRYEITYRYVINQYLMLNRGRLF